MNIILQLHITGNCNLRCKHCYIEEHSCDMPVNDIKRVLRQYDELISELEKSRGEKITAHLHFTGGEPLMHKQIRKVLRILYRNRKKYRYGLMCNGSMLDKGMIKRLKRLKLKACQLSLDGSEKTHDALRGKGNFRQVLSAVDMLDKGGIPVRISFTANKGNYREFPEVAAICYKHKVSSLWSDRYIPVRESSLLEPLDERATKEYVEILHGERTKYKEFGLEIENYRGLQFIGTENEPYFCLAAEHLIVVDEKGNIMPCRRMPLICSDIHSSTLKEVYFNNPVFLSLREHCVKGKCTDCEHSQKCRGGERCMSYAVRGDFSAPDPGCWL